MQFRVLMRRHRAQAALAAVAILMLGVVSLTGWTLLDARKAVLRQAEQAAANLVLSLERDIARNIEIYDLSLKAAAASFFLPGLKTLDPEIRQAVLFDGALQARYFGKIAIVDATGENVFASNSARPSQANFADRDWFAYLRAHPESELHLSLTPNSLISRKPSLVLSRPITGAGGGFAGAVVGVIYLDYFHQLFSGLGLNKGGAINLFTMDGRIVARHPFEEHASGRDVSRAEVFQRLGTEASGSFETRSVLDGVERLYVHRRLSALPLVVQVGLSTHAIYAEWRHRAWITCAVLAVFVAVTGLLTWALRRELKHRTSLMAQLRASEASFRLLTEHASDVVSRVGPDGLRRYVSPAATRILGVPAQTLLGRGLLDLVRSEDLPALEASTTRLLSGAAEESGAAFRVHRPDGTEVWIEASARVLHEPDTGVPDGYVAIWHDATERQRVDAEREARGRELEAANVQLERLARHLGKARDQADQASKAKSRFLAGVSHELRTPLNGILGYAQLLRLEGQLDAKQRERVDAMLGAGQHLLEMINRVLDLSEIEAESFEVQVSEVDPQQLAGMCLGLLRPAAEAKRLELRYAAGPNIPKHIMADPARLRQILLNLLGNAVKFTTQGSVELRLLLANSTTLRAEVVDSGPGISPEQRHRLFQDFERLDAKLGNGEGAGLGLAISLRLAALMGGRMGHEENSSGGSVFWLELPMVVATDMPVVAATRVLAPQPSPSLRLLVVDDVAMNRDIASSFLRAAGHDVTCAEDGAGAVEEASAQDYDAVLMDVRMPGMDGLEATRRLRALVGPRGQVPVIAVTAQAFAGQVEECRRAGMNSHVTKPFTQKTLLDAVACAVTKREAIGSTGLAACTDMPPAGPLTNEHAAASLEADAAEHDPDMIGSDLPICDAETFERTAAFLPAGDVAVHLKTLSSRSETLRRGLSGPDFTISSANALSGAAHTLAGSAGMFGFQRLALLARHFEQAAENASPETMTIAESLVATIEASIKEMQNRTFTDPVQAKAW